MVSKLGITGIFKNYSWENFSRSLSIPILLTTFMGSVVFLSGKNVFSILVSVIDLALSILPNLLGFLFGVYALIIGFSNIDLLKKMAEFYPEQKKQKISLYQSTSAIFSFLLVLLVFSLILCFTIKFIVSLEIHLSDDNYRTIEFYIGLLNMQRISFHIDFYRHCEITLNWTALISVLFLVNYSLFALLDAIKNVFAFTQSFQLFLNPPNSEPDK